MRLNLRETEAGCRGGDERPRGPAPPRSSKEGFGPMDPGEGGAAWEPKSGSASPSSRGPPLTTLLTSNGGGGGNGVPSHQLALPCGGLVGGRCVGWSLCPRPRCCRGPNRVYRALGCRVGLRVIQGPACSPLAWVIVLGTRHTRGGPTVTVSHRFRSPRRTPPLHQNNLEPGLHGVRVALGARAVWYL